MYSPPCPSHPPPIPSPSFSFPPPHLPPPSSPLSPPRLSPPSRPPDPLLTAPRPWPPTGILQKHGGSKCFMDSLLAVLREEVSEMLWDFQEMVAKDSWVSSSTPGPLNRISEMLWDFQEMFAKDSYVSTSTPGPSKSDPGPEIMSTRGRRRRDGWRR